ncbi:MAG TPA: hypothetical protein VN577_11260 [Terriglobales bacterium]|nr:hypothetical protein [Terriglobales bacterium]
MEDRVLFALIWRLAMREHEMLHAVLPIAQEMGACLRDNVKPDPELLDRWVAVEKEVHRNFGQLTEQIAGIQQMVSKLPYNLA